jgi:transposase
MTKHTEQFKIKAVKDYLAGSSGFKTVARRHGVAAPVLRRWVEWYRLHGTDGLTRKHRRYSAEFKLSVLRHMWDNSLSQTQAAAVFNLGNPASIGIWERRYLDGGLEALARPPRTESTNMTAPTSKPEPTKTNDEDRTRDELLSEVLDLRAEVAYLKKLEALVQAKKKSAALKKRK